MGFINLKIGSIENESSSSNKFVCSVFLEIVYERFDIENDIKGEKLEEDLRVFCCFFFIKFFSDEMLKIKILDKYFVLDVGDFFVVKLLDSFISFLLEKRNK